MTRNELAIFSGLGSVLLLVAIWCLILWLAAAIAGWRRLARRFGDTALFAGDVTRFASAQFGLANYSGALRIGASDFGLYFATVRIFRPFHPPLFIPWTEIHNDSAESRVGSGVRLSFPSSPGVRVTLFGRSADRVRPYLRRTGPAGR